MRFRFLHCADAHLGKYAHQSAERYGDYFAALGAVVGYACSQGVDAVLIAGDLFDEQEPSNETLRRAMEVLRPLRDAGIPVAAIEGNHDRRKRTELSGALDLLHSEGYLRLLRPRFEEQSIVLDTAPGGAIWRPVEGIAIAGIGFIAHNIEDYLAQAASQLPADDMVILLAHVMVTRSGDMLEYGCVSFDDIQVLRDRVGYLALGHRHTRVGLGGETDGWIFNPGSLEYVNTLDYRLPPELRGFYDATISDTPLDPMDGALQVDRQGQHLQVRHVATDKRPAFTLRLDITGAARPEDVVELLRHEAETAFDETVRAQRPIVIVRLLGSLGMSRVLLPREAMAALLRQEFGALHVEVLIDEVLGTTDPGILLLDEGGLEQVADRARVIACDLLRNRGIANGKEEELAAVLIDIKTQLHGVAKSPSSGILEDVRRQVRPFVELPGGEAPDVAPDTDEGREGADA